MNDMWLLISIFFYLIFLLRFSLLTCRSGAKARWRESGEAPTSRPTISFKFHISFIFIILVLSKFVCTYCLLFPILTDPEPLDPSAFQARKNPKDGMEVTWLQ